MDNIYSDKQHEILLFAEKHGHVSSSDFSIEDCAFLVKEKRLRQTATCKCGNKPVNTYKLTPSGEAYLAALRQNDSRYMEATNIAKKANVVSVIALIVAVASLVFSAYQCIF